MALKTTELYEEGSSEPIETTTFVEKTPVRTGELVLETDDDKAVWFYAAQAQGAYIKVSIEGDHSGKFEYLNTMKPITVCFNSPSRVELVLTMSMGTQVRQAPTTSSKFDFYLSAVRTLDLARYFPLILL